MTPRWTRSGQHSSGRDCQLLMHPHHGSAMDELGGFGHALPVALGFPIETTVALTRLLFAGVMHRYPRLRLVGSHGGGTLPYLVGRLDAGWRSDPSLAVACRPSRAMSWPRLFLDAVLYHPRALHAAADLVGAGAPRVRHVTTRSRSPIRPPTWMPSATRSTKQERKRCSRALRSISTTFPRTSARVRQG